MFSKKSPYAIYTPAISANFARLGYGTNLKRIFPFNEADLNFLNLDSRLFHYPYALYSAGQAAKTDGAAAQKSSVSERNGKHTTVIGDSGGFQIQQGTIRFDGDTTTERMLRWMEKHADFSMSFEFPTGGISSGKIASHAKRLRDEGYDLDALAKANGLSIDYNVCLQQSLINLDYFVKHRKRGATKILNVIQGRNEHESKVWYDAVKGYGFEGWAFAGMHQSSFTMLLNRLVDMKIDGLLQQAKWIHVLGVSKLVNAYLFNTVLQCIRKFNPTIQMSYDSASPFLSAANLEFCSSYRIDKYGVDMQTKSIKEVGTESDSRTLNQLCSALLRSVTIKRAGMQEPIYIVPTATETAIGAQVKVSDICQGSNDLVALDSDSYFILMNHNVQAYVNAFAELNRGFTQNRLQDQVPPQLRIAREIIETVLLGSSNSHQMVDPYRLIQESAHILDSFAEK